MEAITKKSLGFADITVYDNGIFHTHVICKTALNLNQAKEITEFRHSVMGEKKALMLSTGEDNYIVPSKEAMDYIKSEDRSLTVKADAFVIKSLSQRMFIKAITGLKRMKTPISFFASNEDAIKWLLSK